MLQVLHSDSLTEATYRNVREELLSGRLEPGSRLKIAILSKQMGVNLSAMREALTRLSAEGMVIAEPQRGFRAAEVSPEDLRDLTRARVDIELLCLHRSMQHGDVAWESRVVASSHALSRTPKPASSDDVQNIAAWHSAHFAFHEALCSACQSPWLLRLREQLSVQNERYLRLSVKLSVERRSAIDEHKSLTEAVLARDEPLVTHLITEHFWITTNNLLGPPAADSSADEPVAVTAKRRPRNAA